MDFFEKVIDWFFNWRFNLCFWAGVVLAFVAAAALPDPINWILAVLVFVAGFAVGLRWDRD